MTTAEAGQGPDVHRTARAKINLTLHVTGQRADGFHLLDSLVVFADLGDRITVRPAPDLRFRVTGPMAAGVPPDDSNLVLRAARAAGVETAEIVLEKNLPAASGIGGGSADAAALLRALETSHGIAPLDTAQVLALGADVPVCLASRSVRMSGIGETIRPLGGIPPLPAVLINPGIPVHTPDAFRALSDKNGTAMPEVPEFSGAAACCDWLADQRNDLQAPVIAMRPVVGQVLQALCGQGARLARMSGSGATCFGVFEDAQAARQAAGTLAKQHTGWWVKATILAPT